MKTLDRRLICGSCLFLALGALVFSPALMLAETSATEDWPRFRGPAQSGTLSESGVLGREVLGLELAWKRPLGSGYSSISVTGGRGVTMFTDGKHDYLTAFDVASGKELWRYRIAEMYRGHSGSDDGPISTPTIADGVVYGLGPFGELFAVRLEDGKEVWSHKLDGEKDSRAPHYGFATVPTVVDDLLVVQTGGPDGHSVTAFDRQSGERRWSTGDEPVSYQSPAVMELGGRRQVVAADDKYLVGLDPATGELLWKKEHRTDPNEAFTLPLALGADRVLVSSQREVVAFKVASAAGGGFEVEELWRSNAFQRSYAIPVPHENRLFGFNGRFLTCVDADTGEVAWKSRPPNGQGLILVDDKLLVVSNEGDLVVSRASPDGYAETARLAVFEGAGGITPPSYAGGYVFMRNLEELAAVRVTDAPTAAMTERKEPERTLLGRFGELVAQVEASGDTRPLDAYLAAHEARPIVEDGGVTHFIYQGEVDDIAMSANFLAFREEVVLDRVAGTDVYFKSFALDPKAVWEYRYSVNFGEAITDPANPLTVDSIIGPMSELRMPGFEAPPVNEELKGRLDSFQFHSDLRDNDRRVWVYIPPGYARSQDRYPLLIVQRGDRAVLAGRMETVLDGLISAKRIAPLIAAFVPQVQGEYESDESPDFVRMLTEELVAHLDKHYRTLADPASRGLTGVLNGGAMSIYIALKAPGSFGKVATQSLFLRGPFADDVLALIEAGDPSSLKCYLDWRSHDLVFGEVIDSAAHSRKALEALQAKGFAVTGREVPGGWGWSSWLAELGQALAELYPAGGEQ